MKEKFVQKNTIRLPSFKIINVIFKEQNLKRNTRFWYAPFLKTGKKNSTWLISISWNPKCTYKGYCIMHEMQSQIKFVNQRAKFWLGKLITWGKPISTNCRVWAWRQCVNVHNFLAGRVYCKSHCRLWKYPLLFESEISIWNAQKKVRIFAYCFPELFSSYSHHLLSNGGEGNQK